MTYLISITGNTVFISSLNVLTARASTPAAAILECFQVSPPVETPVDALCTQVLMVHSFANSYGNPFLGDYVPPLCDFNRVTFNFTVTSAGRQFDRLGLMYLNDTEIWRLSTAEPTSTGIEWTYLKDMSHVLALFKEPQRIIFDLGNLINDVYTAPFNTTLTAMFFKESSPLQAADLIIPVSARQGAVDKPSAFIVPDAVATNDLMLPQNVRRAVFSISACGQAAEEFWWSNVLSSDTATFNGTTLNGYSPFREVQLLIDGIIAGITWPFPVIFTGGVVPGLWRPIVGIDAFDLIEDGIDITPFLPLLCDGGKHRFEIRVAGISDDGKGNARLTETVASNWVVTGKIFIWSDEDGYVTSGTGPIIQSPPALIALASKVGQATNGTNSTLDYHVNVDRSLDISATIQTSSGTYGATWSQRVTYSNVGNFSNSGNDQLNMQKTNGMAASNIERLSPYSSSFSYPIMVASRYMSFPDSDNFTLQATMDRGKDVKSSGALWFLLDESYGHSNLQSESTLSTHQNGTATYYSIPAESRAAGFGSTEQKLVYFDDISGYSRHVRADNSTITFDDETIQGQAREKSWSAITAGAEDEYVKMTIKDMVGRGPIGLGDEV
ncbi:hypothetical protein EJ05DRAFT_437066 [Pseudovirgaria hyperparasitica]|uniref:Peptide N-acetyl-beta-D-glucosaminyl asparaginase amidase A N-terminal domain-containing protein n=1 Tax=Pseudovirgaria hyperparasitica TaxID=470096 RepID=A0A6A6WC84_9PEZI|nr:uncharacterized protein EJ05DRAFT_437066 [Pseudovirgaria hyperparasitica]KAF2759456.1 hypothetical protein EJ05DRAFT_437066 [Pseudovirgaria hyperparasitica]